jgi:hypothetical protein
MNLLPAIESLRPKTSGLSLCGRFSILPLRWEIKQLYDDAEILSQVPSHTSIIIRVDIVVRHEGAYFRSNDVYKEMRVFPGA